MSMGGRHFPAEVEMPRGLVEPREGRERHGQGWFGGASPRPGGRGGASAADRLRSRPTGDYAGETYYDIPTLHPPVYGWLVVGYFFLGGIAGGTQLVAAVADLVGDEHDRAVARAGRYLSLATIAASPVLLTLDLHDPRRFYNMLRIARPTSAMSLGSWLLTLFGGAAGLVAMAQAADDLLGGDTSFARLARGLGMPAALLGGGVASYTGVLLGGSSIPVWTAVSRRLPLLFLASALSTALAAISGTVALLGSDNEVTRVVDDLAIPFALAELAALGATVAGLGDLAGPLTGGRQGRFLAASVAGGLGLPLAFRLTGRDTRRPGFDRRLLTATLTLVGGFLLRAAVVFAGRESASRPRDYFRYAQPARGGRR